MNTNTIRYINILDKNDQYINLRNYINLKFYNNTGVGTFMNSFFHLNFHFWCKINIFQLLYHKSDSFFISIFSIPLK